MQVQQVILQAFRNYLQKSLSFTEQTTIIVGPNARGKTSIIEALGLLASGTSFRAETVPEMIQFNQELGRVNGVVWEPEKDDPETVEVDEQVTLEVVLTRGQVQGKKTALRLYSVNGVRRRKKDFTKYFTTVIFRPEDMRLVEGSPSRRRSYLDTPLVFVDQEYERALSTYEQALIRRNKLLHQIREGEQNINVLTYWNMTLAKHGEYLTAKRQEFLNFCRTVDFPLHFTVEYDVSPITVERIAEYQSREIAAGHTLIGPHKDDVIVKLSEAELRKSGLQDEVLASPTETLTQMPIAAFGSRGQQRLAVLWLKMCEYEFLLQKTQAQPLLLLDDILSELDHESRAKVMELLGQGQAIITTTEPRIVDEIRDKVKRVQVIEL